MKKNLFVILICLYSIQTVHAADNKVFVVTREVGDNPLCKIPKRNPFCKMGILNPSPRHNVHEVAVFSMIRDTFVIMYANSGNKQGARKVRSAFKQALQQKHHENFSMEATFKKFASQIEAVPFSDLCAIEYSPASRHGYVTAITSGIRSTWGIQETPNLFTLIKGSSGPSAEPSRSWLEDYWTLEKLLQNPHIIDSEGVESVTREFAIKNLAPRMAIVLDQDKLVTFIAKAKIKKPLKDHTSIADGEASSENANL